MNERARLRPIDRVSPHDPIDGITTSAAGKALPCRVSRVEAAGSIGMPRKGAMEPVNSIDEWLQVDGLANRPDQRTAR
nr:hypothetical protein [Sphingomonas sp. PP-F2F-G114-C0414]